MRRDEISAGGSTKTVGTTSERALGTFGALLKKHVEFVPVLRKFKYLVTMLNSMLHDAAPNPEVCSLHPSGCGSQGTFILTRSMHL